MHLLLVVAFVGLVGCGSQTSATSKADSHQSFVRAMDAICKKGNATTSSLNAQIRNLTSLPAAAPTIRTAAAEYERSLENLRNLKPPSADRKAFARYMQAASRTRGIIGRLAAAAAAGDTATFSDLEAAAASEKRQRLDAALDLGADACGH